MRHTSAQLRIHVPYTCSLCLCIGPPPKYIKYADPHQSPIHQPCASASAYGCEYKPTSLCAPSRGMHPGHSLTHPPPKLFECAPSLTWYPGHNLDVRQALTSARGGGFTRGERQGAAQREGECRGGRAARGQGRADVVDVEGGSRSNLCGASDSGMQSAVSTSKGWVEGGM